MSRRMINPQTIIKSQIVDDKEMVDLNEILEKYGTPTLNGKSVTLQFYSKETSDDGGMQLTTDTDIIGHIIPNTAITITKDSGNDSVYISGLIVDNLTNMNLLRFIEINDGNYKNGIIIGSNYPFDVHVIKV